MKYSYCKNGKEIRIKDENEIIIDENAEELFFDIFNFKTTFNKNLKSLYIDNYCYDGELNLPPNLEELHIDQGTISKLTLPKTLKILYIGAEVLEDLELPETLISLSILGENKLPSKFSDNVETLEIGSNYDQSLTFPRNLKSLRINYYFDENNIKNYDFPQMPSSLESLEIVGDFTQNFECPENLLRLKLVIENCPQIKFNSKLKSFTNYGSFVHFDFPDSLQKFKNYSSSNGTFTGPKNLKIKRR